VKIDQLLKRREVKKRLQPKTKIDHQLGLNIFLQAVQKNRVAVVPGRMRWSLVIGAALAVIGASLRLRHHAAADQKPSQSGRK
jgi:hypothetical protein